MTNNLEHRKTILRKISSGLYIATIRDNENVKAAVLSFAMQTSFEPLLIAFAINKDSRFYSLAKSEKQFAVHLPAKEQQDMVTSFFKVKEQTTDTINGYAFKWSELNNPIIDDIPMILEVKVVEIVELGDHPVFITEVVNTILNDNTDILTMSDTNWHYGG